MGQHPVLLVSFELALPSEQSEKHVCHLLNLIGVRSSIDGKKWLPFNENMAVLGVVLDLERCKEGVVSFKHTEARRGELEGTLNRHLGVPP